MLPVKSHFTPVIESVCSFMGTREAHNNTTKKDFSMFLTLAVDCFDCFDCFECFEYVTSALVSSAAVQSSLSP